MIENCVIIPWLVQSCAVLVRHGWVRKVQIDRRHWAFFHFPQNVEFIDGQSLNFFAMCCFYSQLLWKTERFHVFFISFGDDQTRELCCTVVTHYGRKQFSLVFNIHLFSQKYAFWSNIAQGVKDKTIFILNSCSLPATPNVCSPIYALSNITTVLTVTSNFMMIIIVGDGDVVQCIMI